MDRTVIRHCRHCWGNCMGNCLLPDGTGLCIHQPVWRRSFRQRLRLLGNRAFWRRVLWGSGAPHS